MADISIDITAGAVAWYGGIVATVAAAVSIINAFSDRARVHINDQATHVYVSRRSRVVPENVIRRHERPSSR